MNIRKIFGYYWPHVKRYKWGLIVSLFAFMIATIAGGILVPIVYKEIFDLVASGTPNTVYNELILHLGVAFGLLFLTNLAHALAEYTYPAHQSKVLKSLNDFAFSKVLRHSEAFFSNNFTGGLVAKVNRFHNSFERIQDIITFQVWLNGIVLLSTFAVLFWYSKLLALVFVLWLVFFIVGTLFFLRPMSKRDMDNAEQKSKSTAVLADAITNVVTAKMFASVDREHEVFKTQTQSEEAARWSAWKMHNHLRVFQMVMTSLAEIGGLAIAVHLWISGQITIGVILLMQIYLFRIFEIVWNMGRQMTAMINAFADAQEIVDIFEEPIGVVDIEKPEKCKITDGAIEVDKIGYSYHKAEEGGETLFNNFSLSVAAGEKVGLVGHSGSGKTTITKLLLRFMDVDSGEIRIDGQNIAKIKQDDLRRNISYVPQDPILFHRSLRENIAYGKPSATEEEIVAAAKAANAHDFISVLPDGYDTLVGERGVKLSGGERQRVAIARAMLKDAPILILDEATSALDSISERHIQQAFERLMQGRTTLAIAHRLSTVQKMDRIVVFDKGKIAEQGTHKELTKHDGIYAELWQEQSSGFIE